MIAVKIFLYFKHILRMCFINKFRFFLTVIGLLVGLFLFSFGNILIDSYYNESIKNASQTEENTVILSYESSENIQPSDIYNNTSVSKMDAVISSDNQLIYAKKYSNETMCTMSASILGVSDISTLLPISYNENEYIVVKPTIIKGRMINSSDVAQDNSVVVIDEFTEKLLFPNRDSIGKEIVFDINIPGTTNVNTEGKEFQETRKCTVIGVVKNSYCVLQEEMKYNKFIKNKQENIILKTLVYTPKSYLQSNFDVIDQKIIAWSSSNNRVSEKIKNSAELYKTQSLKEFNSYSIFDKNIILLQAKNELKPLKFFFLLITVALLLISGINAMSTMFFSIKERINEIGIKKALGATSVEILTQFVIEGIVTAFISSIFAVLLSVLTAYIVQFTLNETLFVIFDVHLTIANIFMPVLVAIIYGFIFSIIPSYYGARIKVTDSLRFE